MKKLKIYGWMLAAMMTFASLVYGQAPGAMAPDPMAPGRRNVSFPQMGQP